VTKPSYSTVGEEVVASYFVEHGVSFEFEPPWSEVLGIEVADNPDFLVDPGVVRAVVEVKQFETTRLRDRFARSNRTVTLGDAEVFGSIRRQMTQPAREQLLAFAGLGVPLVVALTNPLGGDVALDFFHVAHAILGNPKYTIPVGPEGPVAAGEMIAEDYGAFVSVIQDGQQTRLVNQHPHVSAVAVINERELAADWRQAVFARQPRISPGANHDERVAHFNRVRAALEQAGPPPEGAYRWASVYDLSGNPTEPGFQGTPLPRSLFAGPRDEWLGFRGGEFGELDPTPRPFRRYRG
jgi:hypothetical protein